MPTYKQTRLDQELIDPANVSSNAALWHRLTGIAPTMASVAWSAADRAIYCPIWAPKFNRQRGRAPWVANGATVSGLFQMGVYSPDDEGKPGARLSLGEVQAQIGTNEIQFANLDNGFDALGLLYVAIVFDNTTAEVIQLASLTTRGDGPIMGGIAYEESAFPLPAVATPVLTPVALNVPIVGWI